MLVAVHPNTDGRTKGEYREPGAGASHRDFRHASGLSAAGLVSFLGGRLAGKPAELELRCGFAECESKSSERSLGTVLYAPNADLLFVATGLLRPDA